MSLKFETGSNENALAVVTRMFYLAWKACGGPVGFGRLQDRGPDVPEEDVLQNIISAGDYPGAFTMCGEGKFYADYVIGRMMQMGVELVKKGFIVPTRDLDIEYQSWAGRYPSYVELAQAAADELGIQIKAA